MSQRGFEPRLTGYFPDEHHQSRSRLHYPDYATGPITTKETATL